MCTVFFYRIRMNTQYYMQSNLKQTNPPFRCGNQAAMAAWILELKMGSSNNCSLGFNKKPSSKRCKAAFAAAVVLPAVPVADATAAESAEAAPEILGSGQATFGPKGPKGWTPFSWDQTKEL